jgi:hypothetical protein
LNALFLKFILKVIFGTIGNLIVFLICQNKRLRSITTFNLLSIISISKTISLYQFNLNHFFEFPLQLKIESFKNFESYCKYIGFVQFSSLQYSAWLSAILSLDRLYAIKSKNYKNIKNRVIKVMLICGLLLVIILTINAPNLIKVHASLDLNESISCLTSKNESDYFVWIHLIVYSVIPFCLITITNLILVITFTLKQKKTICFKPQFLIKKERKMICLTISYTICYLISSLPSSFMSIFFYQFQNFKLIILVCDSILFSNNAFNLFILILINKLFWLELKFVLKSLFQKVK